MIFEEQVPVDVWGTNTRKHRFALMWRGLSYTGKTHYDAILPISGAAKLERYCQKKNILFISKSHFAVRSTGYRREFFSKSKPFIGKLYICAYCGRLISADSLTVDHIYPVAAVTGSLRLQKKLAKKGYSSVNDVRNLVAACPRCNRKKGASTSAFWTLKAKIGRNYSLWMLRKALRLAILIGLIFYIYTLLPLH